MIRDRAVGLARLGVLVALFIAATGCDTAVPTSPAPPPVYSAVESDFDPGFPLPRAKPCPAGLLEAVRHRDLTAVARLVATRADFNCGDPASPLPLDLAVVQGASDLVEALLEHGADPNARWCPFESRVGMTTPRGRVIPGCRSARGVTPLAMAAREDRPDFVRLLLDAGATPLMLAALGQRVAIVKRLLEAGADPGLRDWRGRTAYDYACYDGAPRPELEALVTR